MLIQHQQLSEPGQGHGEVTVVVVRQSCPLGCYLSGVVRAAGLTCKLDHEGYEQTKTSTVVQQVGRCPHCNCNHLHCSLDVFVSIVISTCICKLLI